MAMSNPPHDGYRGPRAVDRLRFGLGLVFVGFSGLFVTPAHAQVVWSGGASTGAWNNTSNWSGGVLPASTDVAQFDASAANGQYTLTLGSDRTVLGLDFTSAGSNGFTFNAGNALIVGTSGISNNNTQAQTFNAEVRTSADQTWAATSGGLSFGDVRLASNLTLTGGSAVGISGALTNFGGNRTLTTILPSALTLNDVYLSNNTNNRLLTFAGTGDIVVNGIISGAGGAAGAGRLKMSGSGTLTLNQANTFNGGATITGGTVVVGTNAAFGTGDLLLNGNGVTLDNGGNNRTIDVATRMNNNTVLTGSGGFSFTNTFTASGNNKTLTVNSGGANSLNDVVLSYNGNARTLIVDGTGNLSIGGIVADGATAGGGLTMQGSGQLNLTGANTYTGATTLTSGTVQVGNDTAFGTGAVQYGTVTLQGDGTARSLANTGTLAGNLTIAGSSDLTLSGPLTLTGNRTLTVSNSGATTLGDIALSDGATNRTLTANVANNATIGGVISNGGTSTAGALTKTGAGTLTLAGANTYDGATTVSAGTLVAANAGALGTTTSGTTVATGATLELQGNSTITGEALTVTGTGRLYNATGSNAFGGDVSGTGVVTVDGGTLALTGNNSYDGATTVNGGTLVAGSANALGSTAAGTTVASGATLELQGNTTIASEALTVTGTGRLHNATGTNTYGGAISGTGGVTVDGGQLTLTTANSYSGATTVNSGTLTLGGDSILNTATDVTLGALGTFDLAGHSQRVGNLAASGGAALDFGASLGANDFVFGTYTAPGSGVLVISNWENGVDRLASTLAGQDVSTIYFSGLGEAQEATSTTSLLGTNAYLLTAVAQTFREWDGSASNLWNNKFNWSSNKVPTSTQYALFDSAGLGRTGVSLNASGQTIGGIEFGVNATSGYTLSSATSETLALAGAVPFIRQKSASDQTIALAGLTLNNNTVADITGTGNLVISAAIADGGGGYDLIRDGAGSGKLILSGNNTFSGGLYLNNGIVQAQSSAALGTGAAVLASGTTLELSSPGTIANNMSLAGSGVGNAGVIHNLAGANTLSGTLTESGSTRFAADSGTTLNLTGNLTGSGTATTFAGPGDLNVSEITTGSGGVTIESGNVAFTGGSANTYTGVTTANGGTLTLNKTAGVDAIGAGGLAINTGASVTLQQDNQINDAAAVTLAGTGTLDLNGKSETIAQLNSASTSATVTLGTGSLRLGAAGAVDSTYDGTVTGTGASSLDVDGGGVVYLTGNNSGYAGTTTVTSGTLNASGSNNVLGTGTASVASGGSLQVAGGLTLANNLTVNGTGAAGNGAIENTGGDNTLNGTVALNSDTTIGTTTGNLAIAGTVSGTGALTKAGANTLTLAANNTYTGPTTVAAGTLAISADANLGAAPGSPTASQLVLDGGTLRTTADLTLATNRGIEMGAGNGTVEVDAGTTATYGGIIAGSGNLTKDGTGTLVLNGADTNTGTLTLTAGTLELNAAQSFTGNNTLTAGTVIVGSDAAFGTGNVHLYNATIQGDGSAHTLGNSNNLHVRTDGGVIAGSSDLTFGGTAVAHGDRTLSVTNTGLTTFNNLNLSNNNTNHTFTLNNTGDVVISGTIANGGTSTSGLTKTGTGTLTLSGANTYTGATAVNAGTLVANGSGPLASTSITVGDGAGPAGSASVLYQQSNQIADTAAVTINGDGLLNLAGHNDTVGSIAGGGTIVFGTGQLTTGGNNADSTFSGQLAGAAGSLLTKSGSGTLTISSNVNGGASGDFLGDLQLDAGTLALANAANTFANGTLTIAAGATLKLSDATLNIANLNLTGTGTITLDFSGSASVLNVTDTLTIAAGISVNIINWQDAVDFFYAANWAGAVVDVRGNAPMNQVVFDAPAWNGNDTKWQSYDKQVTPVPEPSAYGALLLAGLTAWVAVRRRRRRGLLDR